MLWVKWGDLILEDLFIKISHFLKIAATFLDLDVTFSRYEVLFKILVIFIFSSTQFLQRSRCFLRDQVELF